MEEVIDWLVENKQWLFSGVGVALVAWVDRILYKRRKNASTQEIRSGRSSTNIQAGRDVNLNSLPERDDAEEER